MLPIIICENGTTVPDVNCYLITQDGIYLKKNTGLITAVVKVEKISCLQKIAPSVSLNLPPIPLELFAQIRLFFKAVYECYESEAIVLFYFDEVKREYSLSVPNQFVSPASLDYKIEAKHSDLKLVGSIHSHANFEAFHSFVDINDEAHFDGLHITMGNVDQESFSLSVEVVVNNNRFAQAPENWIVGLRREEKLEKPKLVNKKDNDYFIKEELKSIGVHDQFFGSLFPKKITVYNFLSSIDLYSFPSTWMGLVQPERRFTRFDYPNINYPKRVIRNEKD